MSRAHFANLVRECERIEAVGKARNWSAAEIEFQIRAAFDCANETWAAKGWITVEHFIRINANSKLDMAAIAAGERVGNQSTSERKDAA